MTSTQANLLKDAKQGNVSAIADLINRSLQPKGISAKVSLKNNCLRVMLESSEVPLQDNLVNFIHKGIVKLNIPGIQTIKVYGKSREDDFPEWIQEVMLSVNLHNSDVPGQSRLQTNYAYEVLEQFQILQARTSVGISYVDLPPVVGKAKIALKGFERSPDYQVCSYLTEMIEKIMLYYELSIECLGSKVKAAGTLFGLGAFGGISVDEPLGQVMQREFPEVKKTFGIYDFDVILSSLWIKAGKLTDELNEILCEPVDLDALKHKKLEA